MDVVRAPDFLSNELVDGELLSDKMSASRLSPEEALQYGLEIGKALAMAHGRGLVHGCLAPHCISIAADGVHLLKPSQFPAGCSARYRSPEQIRGEQADWRSDIFAFGVLLFEMASGRSPFPGQGSELEDALPKQAPAGLLSQSPIRAGMEGVIAGCLQQDPARRRQRIQNAVIELRLAGRVLPSLAMASSRRKMPLWQNQALTARFDSGMPTRQIPHSVLRSRFAAIGLATLALAASGVAAVLYLHQRAAAPPVKFPVAGSQQRTYPSTPSISPDGLSLTYSADGPEGRRVLWLRALHESHAKVIAGTDGGFAPFWSPDSEYIAFFADGTLKRIHVRKGPAQSLPETIAAVESQPGGGAWNKDGTILFAPGMNDGLYQVAASGGKISAVLQPDAARFERAYLWPKFLPDGKHFIFFNETGLPETSGVYAGNLDSAESRKLFGSETNAVYSPAAGALSSKYGYLLYMRDRDLMVQRFDTAKLTIEGEVVTLASDIGSIRTLSLAPISVSDNAVLVYQTVGVPLRRLVWLDRTGRQTDTAGEGGMWGPPRVSPDGNRVIAGKLGADGVNADLWMFDANGDATPFVQTPRASAAFPVWSPDGKRVAYWSDPEGVNDIYVKPVNGAKAELLYRDDNAKYPTDWSHDGRFILFHETVRGARLDVMGLSLPDKHAGPIVNTVRNEVSAALSPDGKWLAYQADDTGRYEVYVQPFEGLNNRAKPRWKISSDLGFAQNGLPRWRRDGKELFYTNSAGHLMSVNFSVKDGEFVADPPKSLFQTRAVPTSWNAFDVSPDGQRFIVNLPLEWSNSSSITVKTGWMDNKPI